MNARLNLIFSILLLNISIANLINLKKYENSDFLDISYRYYDPKLGQFIHADELTPKNHGVGLNRYAYVYNNPTEYNDPSGHVPIDVLDDAKALYGDLSQSGVNTIKKADQFAYLTVAGLADMLILPNIEEDPIGFALSMVGGGSSGMPGNATRAAMIQQRRNLIGMRINARNDDIIMIPRETMEKRLQAAQDNATAHGDISAKHAGIRAYFSELNSIRHENNIAIDNASDTDYLAGRLSAFLRSQLDGNKTGRNLHQVPGYFKPEIVATLEKAWLVNDLPGFTVNHGDITIESKAGAPGVLQNRAIRSTFFSLSFGDDSATLELTAKYTNENYRRLRHQLAAQGALALPEDWPKPSKLSNDLRAAFARIKSSDPPPKVQGSD